MGLIGSKKMSRRAKLAQYRDGKSIVCIFRADFIRGSNEFANCEEE